MHALRLAAVGLLAILWMLATAVHAALPPPTAEQQQAAEKKKAADAEQAAKQKEELAAAIDRLSERWRERAHREGWPTHPPVPVDAKAGITASAKQESASGQPDGKLGSAAKDAPVRSEKSGTAPPSEDVKRPPPSEAARQPAPVRR